MTLNIALRKLLISILKPFISALLSSANTGALRMHWVMVSPWMLHHKPQTDGIVPGFYIIRRHQDRGARTVLLCAADPCLKHHVVVGVRVLRVFLLRPGFSASEWRGRTWHIFCNNDLVCHRACRDRQHTKADFFLMNVPSDTPKGTSSHGHCPTPPRPSAGHSRAR